MTSPTKRVLTALLGVALTLGVASGCNSVKGVGDSTGNKIKQGGDAGGSTGYP